MIIPKKVVHYLADKALPELIQQAIDEASPHLNSAGFDRWGLQPVYLKAAMGLVWPIYKYYFRVKVQGIEQIPPKKVMLVANHSGQIPIDAMLIAMALLDNAKNPRIARAMVEHWVPTLPFISELFTRCGQMVGEPHNCLDLLKKNQCLLVFPEGVRGIGKTFGHRYELQKFGTGFVHLALEAKTPIVPVAVIGCEEIYPTFYQSNLLAKLLKSPCFPITPFFPWLGLAGAIPLPNPIDIYFGDPIKWSDSKDLSDLEIQLKVNEVKNAIEKKIALGLQKRTGFFNQRRIEP